MSWGREPLKTAQRNRTGGELARRARGSAARRYQPERIATLLVAQTPPAALERYFYFEDVAEHDWLFRAIIRETLRMEPSRERKGEQLAVLKRAGIFLIDLKPDPDDPSDLADHVAALVERCRTLGPERIILIKADVYDAAYGPLAAAGLPVIDERIPFPSSGQQANFRTAFRRALAARPTSTS
jgi:hypothetical protein